MLLSNMGLGSLSDCVSQSLTSHLRLIIKMTYKQFGFPVPYLLTGRWGFTPFPSRVPLVYILGEPLAPPENARGVGED